MAQLEVYPLTNSSRVDVYDWIAVKVVDPGANVCYVVEFKPALGSATDGEWQRGHLRVVAADAGERSFEPVSYTHLTLPTICSV